jgi:hypothetical protein
MEWNADASAILEAFLYFLNYFFVKRGTGETLGVSKAFEALNLSL